MPCRLNREIEMQPHGAGPQKIALPGVKSVVAVALGKGGVGNSTAAANLALALKKQGQQVALLDADIYGPSVPIMMGLGQVDPQAAQFPLEKFGIKLMSMGFLVNPNQAMIWRGPMIDKYLRQFLMAIPWTEIDTMVIDLPPGSGDAQLTLTQAVPLSGAVIVTTPQEVSLIDARKGLEMFKQVRVPVLGIVENMSYFEGADGQRVAIFGQGGGLKLAGTAGVPFLGEIPIDPRVAECGDAGDPIVHKYPDSVVARAYLALATTVGHELNRAGDVPDLPGMKF